MWTKEHTNALNELMRHVLKRVELVVIDMTRPATLHVDSDEEAGSVVLTQGEGDTYRIVAMLGYELSITESRLPLMEK